MPKDIINIEGDFSLSSPYPWGPPKRGAPTPPTPPPLSFPLSFPRPRNPGKGPQAGVLFDTP